MGPVHIRVRCAGTVDQFGETYALVRNDIGKLGRCIGAHLRVLLHGFDGGADAGQWGTYRFDKSWLGSRRGVGGSVLRISQCGVSSGVMRVACIRRGVSPNCTIIAGASVEAPSCICCHAPASIHSVSGVPWSCARTASGLRVPGISARAAASFQACTVASEVHTRAGPVMVFSKACCQGVITTNPTRLGTTEEGASTQRGSAVLLERSSTETVLKVCRIATSGKRCWTQGTLLG